MQSDSEVYLRIGELLLSSAPNNAKKIILDVELSPENDHGKFLFDYVDDSGRRDWFMPNSGKVDSELLDHLVVLRKYYVENNLTNNRPPWHGCEVTLDIETMKLSIDFRYPNP